MQQMNELYSKLTGVDIEQQKQLWDERGKGYYGEFLVFCELYQNVAGNCKILMNLQLPTRNGKTTEIDLLMIHETGLFVFEIKHFKGRIYGKINDKTWTQYFRTTPNQTFNNPVLQNEYHVNALKRKYPNLPIHSFIVFTNPDCDLCVTGNAVNVNLCALFNLNRVFEQEIRNKQKILTMPEIDTLFRELQTFSPLNREVVPVNSREIPFYDYIGNLKDEFQTAVRKNKNKVRAAKVSAALFCVVSLLVSVCSASIYKSKCNIDVLVAQQKMNEFAKKFEYVDDYYNGEITISKDMVVVSDVVLKDSVELTNTVCFSCMLTWNGENYCVSIGENAKIIVMLKNGRIQEYDLWNEQYPYLYTHVLGSYDKTRHIKLHEFKGVAVSDIDYIKLINLGIRHKDTSYKGDIASGYEVELYRSAME